MFDKLKKGSKVIQDRLAKVAESGKEMVSNIDFKEKIDKVTESSKEMIGNFSTSVKEKVENVRHRNDEHFCDQCIYFYVHDELTTTECKSRNVRALQPGFSPNPLFACKFFVFLNDKIPEV